MNHKAQITNIGLLLLLFCLMASSPYALGNQQSELNLTAFEETNDLEILIDKILPVTPLQTAPHIYWNHTYGGPKEEYIEAIVECRNGGFAIAGHVMEEPGIGDPSDIYLARLDTWGNLLWQKTYGGEAGEGARGLVECSDGGFVLVGETSSFDIGSSYDLYVVRTDSRGNLLWNRTFGGNDLEWGRAVAILNDTIYVLGYTRSFGAGEADLYLICLDDGGTPLWSHTYGSDQIDWDGAIIPVSTGGFLLAGSRWIAPLQPEEETSLWLVRIATDGTPLWNYTYKASAESGLMSAFGGRYAPSVIECDDGGFAVVSTTIRPNSTHHYYNMDPWLLCTDSNGIPLWNRTYPGTGQVDGAFSLVQCNNSDFLVLCELDDVERLMRVDPTGNPLWNMTLDPADDLILNMLAGCADGGYVVVGYRSFIREEPLPGGGTQIIPDADAYVIRFGYGSLPPQPMLGLPPELIVIIVDIVGLVIIAAVAFGILRMRKRT